MLKAGAPTRKLRRYVIAGVVVIAAAVGAWMTFGGSSTSSAVTYTTVPVTHGGLTVGVTATGTVQPTNEVEISSELSGTVATVDVDFNDRVNKGQTLATLVPDKLLANAALAAATLTSREADVRQAEATVAEAAAAYKRSGQLIAKGLDSQAANESRRRLPTTARSPRLPAPTPISGIARPMPHQSSPISRRRGFCRRSTASSCRARSRSARPSPRRCRRRFCSRSPKT